MPEMKSSLVNIYDLVIRLLNDDCPKFLNKLLLFSLQLTILSLRLVVLVVWSLEAYPISEIVGP